MLTIGICSKKFENEFVEIQKNCLKFASKLSNDIIFLGEDAKNFAKENEFRHYDVDIEDNSPMINSIFKVLQENAWNDFYMYLNSDILLIEKQNLKNILLKIEQKIGKNFMCIGERYEIPPKYIKGKSEEELKGFLRNAVNSGKFAIDYFLLPKDITLNLERMYAGCPGHDNVTIQYCKENNIPIIDISNVLFAVHQDHTCRSKGGWLKSWYGEKSKINRKQIKGHIHSLDDADYTVDFDGNLIKGEKIKRYTNIEMAISNRLEMFRDAIKEEKYMDAVDHWNLVCMRDPKKKYVSEEDKKLFSEVIEELSKCPIEFIMLSKQNMKDYVSELKKLNILWRLHIIDTLDDSEITMYLNNLRKEFPKNVLVYRKLNWKDKSEMYNKAIQNMPNKALLFLLYEIFTAYQIEGIRKLFKRDKNKNSVENSSGKFVYRYEPGYKWSEDEVPKLLDTEDKEV